MFFEMNSFKINFTLLGVITIPKIHLTFSIFKLERIIPRWSYKKTCIEKHYYKVVKFKNGIFFFIIAMFWFFIRFFKECYFQYITTKIGLKGK